MKKALITLDYNPSALKVAERGFSIANTMGVNLTLMHIAANPLQCDEINRVAIMDSGIKKERYSEISQNKIELKAMLQVFLQKSKFNIGDDYDLTFIKENESAESILKVAKKIKADLIFIINMGSQSSRVSQNMLDDSVTENVLFKTIVPVLVIPTKKIIQYSNQII